MIIKRLSMLLFIFGALIAILGGSFEFIPKTETLIIITLVMLGVFIGLINISREEEYGFLLAGGVFILASGAITSLLSKFLLLDIIGNILNNFIVLIAPACIVVSLRIVFEFASQSEWSSENDFGIKNHIKSHFSEKEKIWDVFVLLAISATLIILVLQLFFRVDQFQGLLDAIDWVIILIFFIDLIVLYKQSKSTKEFLIRNWPDMIAIIPLGMIFRLTKLVRFVRIINYLSKAQKIEKINRPMKLFSNTPRRYDNGSKKNEKR
jgi:hypothetical protein